MVPKVGIEPTNAAFAEPCLTTWLLRHHDRVLLLRQALFRTDISLPANLVEGPYMVRIFLTRGGEVVDMQESQIDVQKAGLERTLYRLAMEQPLIYGLLSLLMAMVAGWGAQELFKRLRI